MPYAILSDGCSGSIDTDVGARLLTLAAEWNLKNTDYYGQDLEQAIITTAHVQSEALRLPKECLDATLLMAFVEEYIDAPENFYTRILMYGDGSVALKLKNTGLIVVYTVNYQAICQGSVSSLPLYLSYKLDTKNLELWRKMMWGSEQPTFSLDVSVLDIDKGFQETERLKNVDPASSEWPDYIPKTFHEHMESLSLKVGDEVEWVILMSDGVDSFVQAPTDRIGKRENVPSNVIFKDLLDFAVLKGSFVERQGNWFMKKEAPKKSLFNEDDVALSGIYLGGL
jgi:hypothetical protein